MKKPTLIIGASTKADRYSNKALKKLRAYGYTVFAIGSKKGVVDDVEIVDENFFYAGIHTITMYINESIQDEYLSYLKKLKPNRIIFNPGTENLPIYNDLRKDGIEVVEGCTLVMLASNSY